MFTLSFTWPRDESGKFITPVFVILQKPGQKIDIYNITSLLEMLEEGLNERYVGAKIAAGLCIGGNDFVPKFHGNSHYSTRTKIS